MFAGFIPCGESEENGTNYEMFEHYMFIESENDPVNDPLIIWTNGGPGADSIFGLFTELGPLWLDGESLLTDDFNKTGVPTLFYNEHGWTQVANVLVINSPPPAGFSYCNPEGPTGKGESCGTWNDTKNAQHNYLYLENWMAAFPEFQSNPVYIIGESYAGIYVPTLVREILSNSSSLVGKNL